jgi:alanyl-tRNA synthetase
VIARRDGLDNDDLRRLAQETVRALGSGIVALAGTGPDGVKAGIAVAVSKDLVARGVTADVIARPAARALGGGVGKGADAVVGGGPNSDGIEEALRLVREQRAAWQ